MANFNQYYDDELSGYKRPTRNSNPTFGATRALLQDEYEDDLSNDEMNFLRDLLGGASIDQLNRSASRIRPSAPRQARRSAQAPPQAPVAPAVTFEEQPGLSGILHEEQNLQKALNNLKKQKMQFIEEKRKNIAKLGEKIQDIQSEIRAAETMINTSCGIPNTLAVADPVVAPRRKRRSHKNKASDLDTIVGQNITAAAVAVDDSDDEGSSSSTTTTTSSSTSDPACGCGSSSGSTTGCGTTKELCNRIKLNCGVEFNDSKYKFGPCAIDYISTYNPAIIPTLTRLINIVNINPGVTSSIATTYYFRLPPPNTKHWHCGQIIYVSNVGTVPIIILPPGTSNNPAIASGTLNGTITGIELVPPPTGGVISPPIPGQSGALFILAKAASNQTTNAAQCEWFTLLI